jgi:hypothetical protein
VKWHLLRQNWAVANMLGLAEESNHFVFYSLFHVAGAGAGSSQLRLYFYYKIGLILGFNINLKL